MINSTTRLCFEVLAWPKYCVVIQLFTTQILRSDSNIYNRLVSAEVLRHITRLPSLFIIDPSA